MADPKQLALAHFEKVVLGGFAVCAVLCLTGVFQKPDDLKKGETLQTNLNNIGAHMEKSTVPEPAGPTWEADLGKQLTMGQVDKATPFPAWTMERRPYFFYYHRKVENTESAKHFAPTDIQGDASTRGRVALRWTASQDNTYVICTYEVMRKIGAAGEWTKIADTGAGVTEYTDPKIAPRAQYFYKVISVASVDQEAPVVVKHGLTLAMEEQRKESGECGPFETARDVFVLPVTITAVTEQDVIAGGAGKDANRDGKVDEKDESAYVRIYKWDADSSKFEKKTFTVAAGAAVGERAKIGRRDFDFTTGAVLDDVWFESRKHPTLGHDETVQWVRIRYADGTTEQWNDKDKPAELGTE